MRPLAPVCNTWNKTTKKFCEPRRKQGPENKKYLPELNIDVRPKYYARSSMLLSCFGFVMSLPLGAFIFLRGRKRRTAFGMLPHQMVVKMILPNNKPKSKSIIG